MITITALHQAIGISLPINANQKSLSSGNNQTPLLSSRNFFPPIRHSTRPLGRDPPAAQTNQPRQRAQLSSKSGNSGHDDDDDNDHSSGDDDDDSSSNDGGWSLPMQDRNRRWGYGRNGHYSCVRMINRQHYSGHKQCKLALHYIRPNPGLPMYPSSSSSSIAHSRPSPPWWSGWMVIRMESVEWIIKGINNIDIVHGSVTLNRYKMALQFKRSERACVSVRVCACVCVCVCEFVCCRCTSFPVCGWACDFECLFKSI